MVRKSHSRKHSRRVTRKHRQRGGGCGCGGTSVLGFPQAGGQNSMIGSPNNSMNSPNMSKNLPNATKNYKNAINLQPNRPLLHVSNLMGGFLGLFEDKKQNSPVVTPKPANNAIQSVVNMPKVSNTSSVPVDPVSRLDQIEERLRKLEVGGGFFGGKRRKHHTRKHKSRK